MTRVILIDEQVRAWLESQAQEGDTHNEILRRIFGLDPAPGDTDGETDGDGVPGDRTAPDNGIAADPPTP
ncbi:hypothetical protein ACFHW2_41000 [Actinomadura sp. LOL_016]|uniref:hypothetical protein n=1 Tax=unclassified Actinomadura TaxID=2626254 RepID=UPI003A809BB5